MVLYTRMSRQHTSTLAICDNIKHEALHCEFSFIKNIHIVFKFYMKISLKGNMEKNFKSYINRFEDMGNLNIPMIIAYH